MSITMYYGRAGSGKTRAVYERIRQVIIECPGDPIILLVPEPATYRVERELAEFQRYCKVYFPSFAHFALDLMN